MIFRHFQNNFAASLVKTHIRQPKFLFFCLNYGSQTIVRYLIKEIWQTIYVLIDFNFLLIYWLKSNLRWPWRLNLTSDHQTNPFIWFLHPKNTLKWYHLFFWDFLEGYSVQNTHLDVTSYALVHFRPRWLRKICCKIKIAKILKNIKITNDIV